MVHHRQSNRLAVNKHNSTDPVVTAVTVILIRFTDDRRSIPRSRSLAAVVTLRERTYKKGISSEKAITRQELSRA